MANSLKFDTYIPEAKDFEILRFCLEICLQKLCSKITLGSVYSYELGT